MATFYLFLLCDLAETHYLFSLYLIRLYNLAFGWECIFGISVMYLLNYKKYFFGGVGIK